MATSGKGSDMKSPPSTTRSLAASPSPQSSISSSPATSNRTAPNMGISLSVGSGNIARSASPPAATPLMSPSLSMPMSTVYVDLTPEQLSDLKEIFGLVDKDGSGTISVAELHTLMEMLGMIVTLDEVNAMIEEIDENNDGEIQFEEFVAVMSRKMKATCTSEEIRTAFRVFEGSGPSGQIKFDVLERLLCEHGSRKLTPEEAQALLKDLSHAIDSNGYFKYDEYISEMTSD